MRDSDCVELLRWALPQLHLRWQGFRKVRRQVCKRIERHIQALDLQDVANYRDYLQTHPAEWSILDGLCRVTISHFYRDQESFAALERDVRESPPQGPFDLVLCRNLVLTYFDTELQYETLKQIREALLSAVS